MNSSIIKHTIMKKIYSIPSLTVVTMDYADIVTESTEYGGIKRGGDAEAPNRRNAIWDE